MSSTLEQLGDEAYIAVTTFRRDGTPVSTPVWAVLDGDALLIWTLDNVGKVKRIRRDGAVTVAPCTVRGVPTGPAVPAHATVLGPDGNVRVRALIKKKYGMQGRLVIWGSTIRRGAGATVGVRIVLD